MAFVPWLRDDSNLPPAGKLSPSGRRDQDLVLEEPQNSMTVTVKDVPGPVVVIRPEAIGQWRVLTEGESRGWDKCCDYLILGRYKGKDYAIFMELKRTIPDDEGKKQLRWAPLLLHYLQSAYNIDRHPIQSESNRIVRYFLMGERYKGKFYTSHVPGAIIQEQSYYGITINFSLRKEVLLRELLEERR